jgi:hypothetical protein
MNMMNHPHPDDQEAAMARADLYKMANYSFKLFKMIRDGDQLEGWVQAKITKSADYIASVYHYLEYEMKFSEYGSKIENSDMYTESVREQFKAKLTEARIKLDKLQKKNKKELEEGWEDMMKDVEKKAKEKGTGKFDKKELKPGVTQYTRKSSTFDDGGKDSDTKKAEKKTKGVKENMSPPDGATAPPPKGKDGQYPVVTSGPHKGKRWSPNTPGPTNPAMKEGKKPDFLDMDKDGDKKEPMKKAVADKKAGPKKGVNPFAKKTNEALKGGQKNLDADKDGKLEKSDFAKLRAKKTTEAADKCNHTAKGKSCPVHGLKECGVMETSHQAKTTMKHVNSSDASPKVKAAIGKASKDIKPGVKGYKDRADALTAAGVKR